MNPLLLFALHRLSFLKMNEKLKLLHEFASEKDFARICLFDAEWLLGRRLNCRNFDPEKMLIQARKDLEKTRTRNISFTWYEDPAYPAMLKEIYDPPLVLYYKGSLPPSHVSALAVVGTRKPSLEADRSAFALGLDAAEAGIPLVSGMALGIDGAAHKGVLALNGKTWAVLGTGCDKPYPLSHRPLAFEILESGGGLISEFSPGTGPVRYNFPKRNRIISGLSSKVVIIQAPRRSGALYTADFALEQGRDVAVHECGLSGGFSGGTIVLAEQGAPVIRSLQDLYPAFPVSSKRMRDPYWLSKGTPEQAGMASCRQLRAEMQGEAVFYKGRLQAHG